jgi:hypothetical protein
MATVNSDLTPLASRWWSGVTLAAYAIMLVAMAFHFSDQINPDGVAYLRIAGYYLTGDLGKAVSGYWSPLYSWLLMPWLAMGVPGLLATKLLAACLAVAWVIGVALLGRRYAESSVTRRLLVATAAVSVLSWSMEVISPDVLLAVVLTFYFYVVSDPAIMTAPARAFACGLLGGLAYLAKAYAFPFFIVHLLGTVTLYTWAQAGAGTSRRYLVAALAGLSGFVMVAAPWIGVLSTTYGQLTITTAASSRNVPTSVRRGATNTDRAPFAPGLKLASIESGRLTAWEAPDRVSTRPPAVVSSTLPTAIGPGRIQVLLGNAMVIRDHLSDFDYFQLAIATILGAAFIGFLRSPARAVSVPYLWGSFTVVLFVLGYLPLWARERRYYWPVVGLLMVLSFGLAEQISRALTHYAADADKRRLTTRRWILLATLIVAFSYVQVGSHWLLYWYRAPFPSFIGLAARMEDEARRRGTAVHGPIAGNDWPNTVHLAYMMRLPSFGSTTTEDPGLLASELSNLGIRTYLVFNNEALAERLKQSGRFQPLAELHMNPRGPRLDTLTAFGVTTIPITGTASK